MIEALIFFVFGLVFGLSVKVERYGMECKRLRKHNAELQRYNVSLAEESRSLQEKLEHAQCVRGTRTQDGARHNGS